MSQRKISLDSQQAQIAKIRNILDRGSSTTKFLNLSLDSVVRTAPTTFRTPQPWGTRETSYDEKLFASQREPIIRWLTYRVPKDIFDNWFKVKDPTNPDDNELDRAIQPILQRLNAKQNFIRLFTYERRYGTAILLCAYTGFGTEAEWETPIYEDGFGLNQPDPDTYQGGDGTELLQITPYPWSKVNVEDEVEDDSSMRLGLPLEYVITRGTISDGTTTDLGQTTVHWSKVIHTATMLDENTYEGESVVDAVWDDATGFRNSRWGQYETIFRVGGGFPKFTFPWATREQIQRWIGTGEVTNLNARGYFICGQEGENVEFIGPQNVSLNPEPYNELAFNMMAMGSGVPKDTLKGASAGTIAGSEVNERSYWNFISSEQTMVEPILRELINRLIDTGQVKHKDARKTKPITRNFEFEWNFPEIVSEQSRASTDFMKARADTERMNYLTVNELRESKGLKTIEGGDVVLGIIKQQKVQSFQGTRPTYTEREPRESIET